MICQFGWSTLLALSLIACASSQIAAQTAAPAPLRSGVYPLRAYDGKPLPADIVFPPKGVGPPDSVRGCRDFVTDGSLTLEVEAGRFSFGYDLWNACTRALAPPTRFEGTFEQRGNDLVFHVNRSVTHDSIRVMVMTFSGSVSPSSIRLNGAPYTLGGSLEYLRGPARY
jgi:hypothetical protein